MTRQNRSPLRFVAIACAAAALAFGPAASSFAQSGIGGSSPTTGTTARGESGSPSAPTVQQDSGSTAATNGRARAMKKAHRAHRRHHRHMAHRQHAQGAAMGSADTAGSPPLQAAAPAPAYRGPATSTPMAPAGPAVQTQSSRVDSTGAAPQTGEASRTPATPAMPGR
ncbi:MAG: hypothetical protein V4505_23715 [Pseudomonadota bacterium]